MNKISEPHTRALALLALVTIFPSLGLVQKNLHNIGVAMYVATAALATWRAYVFTRTMSQRMAKLSLLLGVIGLALVFVLFRTQFPEWDLRSDRDEALDLAARELISGRYPYAVTTQLGNPISPLPGAVMLAVPFVLLHSSELQNFFWLVLLIVILLKFLGDARTVLLYVVCLLGLGFVCLKEWADGGDLIANNIYVLLSIIWTLRLVKGGRVRLACLSSALLGTDLSSRANFAFWAPLVFVESSRLAGYGVAARLLGVTAVTWVGVTAPFYLWDPHQFSPLHTLSKLEMGDFPQFKFAVICLMLLLTAGFCLRRRPHSPFSLLAEGALVQAVPLVLSVVFLSLQTRSVDFIFLKEGFGQNLQFPGSLALCLALIGAGERNTALPDRADESAAASKRTPGARW